MPVRHDNDTIFFERELEAMKDRVFEKRYPEFKGRQFVPTGSGYPAGAETIAYEMYDEVGMAKIISNYAKDLPRVDIAAKRFTAPVRSLGDSFGYTVHDRRRAEMTGKPLEARKANAARRAMLRKDDDIIAFGDSEHGLTGFLNHPNIPDISALDNAAETSTKWEDKTPDEILKDLALLKSTPSENTNGVESPNRILLPPSSLALIASTPRSSTSDTTILEFFRRVSSDIDVSDWHYLESAGDDGAKRAVAYRYDEDYIEHPVLVEFNYPVPMQVHGLEFVQNCESRVGGVIVRYPLAAVYMDGI